VSIDAAAVVFHNTVTVLLNNKSAGYR